MGLESVYTGPSYFEESDEDSSLPVAINDLQMNFQNINLTFSINRLQIILIFAFLFCLKAKA